MQKQVVITLTVFVVVNSQFNFPYSEYGQSQPQFQPYNLLKFWSPYPPTSRHQLNPQPLPNFEYPTSPASQGSQIPYSFNGFETQPFIQPVPNCESPWAHLMWPNDCNQHSPVIIQTTRPFTPSSDIRSTPVPPSRSQQNTQQISTTGFGYSTSPKSVSQGGHQPSQPIIQPIPNCESSWAHLMWPNDCNQHSAVIVQATTPVPPKIPRISERMCKIYSDKSKEDVQYGGGLDMVYRVEAMPRKFCKKGINLIVGGVNAEAGEFPHMVAIGFRNSSKVDFKCGGSLISERFVLTAAHCRKSKGIEPSEVLIGHLNLRIEEGILSAKTIPIDKFIEHENYNPRTKKNDIALIKLDKNVEFSGDVQPACLMTSSLVVNNDSAIATGWGYTKALHNSPSDHLQKVRLSIIDNYICKDFENVDNTQMCAGIMAGGKDTCEGDSGGPLQVTSGIDECFYTVIGVTSFGNRFCGGENSPAVYTRVSAYIDWIEQKVWGNNAY